MSADTYTQEAIRDVFISGISSPMIPQRLLLVEKETLTLSETVQFARSLDSAQRNAEVCVTPVLADQHSSATAASPEIDARASI